MLAAGFFAGLHVAYANSQVGPCDKRLRETEERGVLARLPQILGTGGVLFF